MTRYRQALLNAIFKNGFAVAGSAAFGLSWAFPAVAQGQPSPAAAPAGLQQLVEAFSAYLLEHWQQDPKLKDTPPPQIITGISPTSTVFGGCIGINDTGKLTREVGGTSYCPPTNTIFVVQEQLQRYREAFGDAAVGYALAHEYGHYLQTRFKLEAEIVPMELQADCLAGAILGQNYQQLGLTQNDIIAIANTAYNLGDKTHGTGAQRAYAVFTGLGHSNELTCATGDMIKLSKNQVTDPVFATLSAMRTKGGKPVSIPDRGSQLKSISGSLGL
jgi:hypothetical protein